MTGKWLLFFREDEIDREWDKIAADVVAGNLGISAKVATAWHHENGSRTYDRSNRVVCVYTKDYTDTRDVWRVRDRLKQLGHARPLRYKTDAATKSGHYGVASATINEALGHKRP